MIIIIVYLWSLSKCFSLHHRLIIIIIISIAVIIIIIVIIIPLTSRPNLYFSLLWTI